MAYWGDGWLVRLESKSFGWIGWGELGSWIVVGAGMARWGCWFGCLLLNWGLFWIGVSAQDLKGGHCGYSVK